MSRTAESTESTDAPLDASTGAGPMAPLRLVDVVFGAMAAKVVYAAAELRGADLLAEGVQTSEELAERTGTHRPSLRRLLRALAGMGVLTQTGAERFQLGQQLRADAPGSVRELVRMRL